MIGKFRFRRPSHATVVAYLALFAALGGTGAYAMHETIFSSDIVDGEVKNVDLGTGAVTTSKLKLLGYDAVAATESTSSTSFTDLATPGPSVTVTVPANGLVAVFAQVKGKSGGPGDSAQVGLSEATEFPSAATIMSFGNAFTTHWTAPSSFGVTGKQVAGWNVFPATPGTRTFKLQYRVTNAGQTATFLNRRLWVMALRGWPGPIPL